MFAVEWDLVAFKRVPFGGASGDADFVEMGIDLTAADFRMEIRAEKGGVGAALVTLTKQAAGTQGICAIYDPAYYHPIAGFKGPATIIRPQIDETTLEGLVAPAPTSNDWVLYYDLHVTPVGLPKQVYFYGTFTVLPGVTQ